MSNDSMGDAFGGLVVLAFDLLDSEIQRSPERLAEILKSPVVLATAQKGLLSFANAKLKSQTTQLSPADIQKLRSIGDDVLSKAADRYFQADQEVVGLQIPGKAGRRLQGGGRIVGARRLGRS